MRTAPSVRDPACGRVLESYLAGRITIAESATDFRSRGMRTRRAAILACVLAACADADDSACPAPADVPAVENRGPGLWQRQGVRAQLTERWRGGGRRGDQILGAYALAAAAPDAHLAIADFMLGATVVIGPNGSWHDGWTRRGSGPGEVQNPVAVSWTEDGALVVFDVTASKVITLDAPLRPIRELPVPPFITRPIVASGELRAVAVLPDGGVLIVPPASRSDAATSTDYVVVHWRPGAETVDTVAAARVPLLADGSRAGTPAPARPHPVFAASSSGRFAVSAGDARYRIAVHASDGSAERVICRDAQPLPVRDVELTPPEGSAEPALRMPSPPADSLMPFGRLVFGSRGWLWVQRERQAFDESYGAAGAQWDVFDDAGRYLGTRVIRTIRNAPTTARCAFGRAVDLRAVHPSRNTNPGSSDAARRAGSRLAAAALTASTSTTPATVNGSTTST